MKSSFCQVVLSTAVSLTLIVPNAGFASDEQEAVQLCKDKMHEVYRVDNFRNVWAEQDGNHKFRVHGDVKYEGNKYGFDCKVKNGQVKSYNYDGPHPALKDNDDSKAGAALAVGAGLAILTAAALSSQQGAANQGNQLNVSQSVLQDECHDALAYRLRDERHYTANVSLRSSRLDGHTMTGDARVQYGNERPHQMDYTCYFDDNGRVVDSRYSLY